MHNEKKRHNGKKSKRLAIPSKDITSDDLYIFNNEHYFESNEKASEEERSTQIYKIFYAELIKLYVLESGASDITKISETELDQNIFLSSDEYWTINENLYEVSAINRFTKISSILYIYVRKA